MAKKSKLKYPRIETFRLSDLKPADYNPRQISVENLTGLKNCLER